MSQPNVCLFMLRRLREWGVRRIYGYPGDGSNDAKLDHQPVVALVGQQKRMSLGGDYQQEVDLRSLFKDVAGEYLGECVDPRQAQHLIDRAMRTALSRSAR